MTCLLCNLFFCVVQMESIYSGGASNNPYQIVLAAGEGFQPLAEEMKRLEEIDRKLQALMPPAHFASIRSTPTTFTAPSAPPSQVSRSTAYTTC